MNNSGRVFVGIFLGLLIFFGFLIRIISVSEGDMYADDAVNAYRAIGWHDSFTAGQVGPFNILGHTTWWSGLSFQDAPPLSFFIQRVFFGIFGVSDLVSKLPFILSGIACSILFFIYFSKIASNGPALVGAILFSMSSFAIYAGTSGYIEGIQGLFVLLTLLGCMLLMGKGGQKYLYLTSLFLGLSLITKYTSMFLVPAVIFAIVVAHKKIEVVSLKRYALSALILVAVVSPVVIYNLNLYSLTGHFDSAISPMFGMTSAHFGPIEDRAIDADVFGNIKDVMITFSNQNSFVLVALGILSIGFLVFSTIRRRDIVTMWCLLSLGSLIAMFAFLGGGRYVLIVFPVFVILVCWGVHVFYRDYSYIFEKANYKRWSVAVLCMFVAFELFYSINTHLTDAPLNTYSFMRGTARLEGFGLNELESYIRKEVYPDSYPINDIETLQDLAYTEKEIQGRNVLIYDDRINWYSQLWYFSTRQTYYKLPVISTEYLADSSLAKSDGGGALSIDDWKLVSGKNVYVIFAENEEVLDPIRRRDASIIAKIDALRAEMENRIDVTKTEIAADSGKVAFTVYKIGK